MKTRSAILAERTRILAERATKHKAAVDLAARADLAPADVTTLEALVAEVKGIDQRVKVLEMELEITPEGEGETNSNNTPTETRGQGNQQPAPPAVPYAPSTRRVTTPGGAPAYSQDLDDRRFFKNQDLVLRGWGLARSGMLTDEHRQAANELGVSLHAEGIKVRLFQDPANEIRAARERRRRGDVENRAQSTTTTAGGYLVPVELVQKLEEQLAYICPIRDVAEVYRTSEGNQVDFPTNDDTSNAGEMISENSAHNEQDMAFGRKSLLAYQFSSKIVRVSRQLMRDSAFPIQALLGKTLGKRIARAQLPYLTTGTGSSQPEGAVTGSSAGVTSAGATAIAVDDLLNLYHSLDRDYRQNAVWMMHDSILLAIRKLKDSTNQPIFTQSYIEGEPDRLLGKPVIINNSMASTIATTNKTVLFGDFSHMVIRDVNEIEIQRSSERYFEYNQEAFLAVAHMDAKVLSSAAIKRLTQA